MKRRNTIARDDALRINAIFHSGGTRTIEYLDSDTLETNLEHIYLFKLGLFNSFGIDFRSQMFVASNDDAQPNRVLFNYLSEVLPLVQPQADRMPVRRRAAYNSLANAAVHSFWEIYCRFQPFIHQLADKNGVEVDDLGNILGRAILLYDKTRGFKFFSYLDKTLRESVKNLRGRLYAQQYQLPLSAGRLIPQLLWLIDQESLRLQRSLNGNESEQVILNHLRNQPARFSPATMKRIARAAFEQTGPLSLDISGETATPIVTIDESLEAQEEYEQLLARVANAAAKAELTDREKAILFQRLELTYDEDLYTRVESELTDGSLRNRRAQLMVRFIAALHCDDAKRFGKFLLADPVACKPILTRALVDLSEQFGIPVDQIIRCVLNHLALTHCPYRVSITQRGQLEAYLRAHPHAPLTFISGQLFHKFKAGMIDQDRQGFPCIRQQIAD